MITHDDEIRGILSAAKVIASVGVSASTEKPSHWIFYYLMQHEYQVIPVNPTAGEVFGFKAVADLKAITEKVDVVQIFRRPEDVPPVVEQAIQIGARVVWMQKGIVNQQAADRAEAAGLQVVMDRCMMEAHQRLMGGIFTFG